MTSDADSVASGVQVEPKEVQPEESRPSDSDPNDTGSEVSITSPRISTPRNIALSLGLAAAAFGIGTVLIIRAYHQARTSNGIGYFNVFWVGMILVLVPTLFLTTRSWMTQTGVKLVLVSYGIVTFVPKFLMSVSGPVYYDEFGHFRHANDLLSNGNLFNADPYLSVVKDFPGLSAITVGIHELTRLSIWHSGQLVILTAHCSALIIILLLGRCAGLSLPTSAIASLVYSLNPSYMYFDTQYAYESLALPLAFLAILSCVRVQQAGTVKSAHNWTAVGLVAAAICIISHHLSSAFMVVVCIAMVIGVRSPDVDGGASGNAVDGSGSDSRLPTAARRGALSIALFALLGTGLWLGIAAPQTISYIWPHVSSGFTGLVHILIPSTATKEGNLPAGAQDAHTLFGGSGAPHYEQIAAYISPVLILVAAMFALWLLWKQIRKRRSHSQSSGWQGSRLDLRSSTGRLILISMVLTLLYFASLPIALTNGGGEGAHRSWAYTYLGVAIIVGYVIENVRAIVISRPRIRQFGPTLLAVALIVICVGNVAAGETVYYRFPGPYIFGTDTRSITPELRELAVWAQQHLPKGSFVVTDRFTREQIEAYTDLQIPYSSQYQVYDLYVDGDRPTPKLREALKAGGFRYFILDKRIERDFPINSLFEGYDGLNVNPDALQAMRSNDFAKLIHETPNYQIFALHP